MTLGDRIKAAREALDMTQEELGRLCDTTKQTIFTPSTAPKIIWMMISS